MLHYDAVRQVTDQHRQSREDEARAARLVLEARGRKERRARRRLLPALVQLLAAHRSAATQP